MGLHQCPSERKGEGVPVRSLRVPSHVPSHPQTAAKVRGFSPIASGFAAETDWLLEGGGFEPTVPPEGQRFFETAPESGDDKPARYPVPVLTIDKGRFTLRRARLAPAMISTPGHRASRRRQRGALPAWSLFGL